MKIKKRLILTIFITFSVFNLNAKKLNLGIFDSTTLANSEGYKYRPFIDLAESVDFNVDYKAIADIQNLKPSDLDKYKVAIFVIGSELIRNFLAWTKFKDDSRKSPVTDKFLTLIQEFGKKKDKLISFAFAPGAPVSLYMAFLNYIGLTPTQNSFEIKKEALAAGELVPISSAGSILSVVDPAGANRGLEADLKLLFSNVNNFLSLPMITRGYMYDTTLMPPHAPKRLAFGVTIRNILDNLNSSRFALPTKKDYSPAVNATLPYGIYWFNPIRQNYVLFLESSLLTFSGIAENFRVCPMNFDLRKEMLSGVQQMLWELNVKLSNKKEEADKIIKEQNKPELPEYVKNYGKPLGNINPAGNNLRKVGWMEISQFNDTKKEAEQRFLIDCIFKSGADALWIDFNPHMFHGSRAIDGSEQKRDELWTRIRRFTKMLQEVSEKTKQKIPKILIGFEIANNFRGTKMPEISSWDLYGNKYESVPSHFDRMNFWKTEIKDSLKIFMDIWRNPENSHGVQISGIVLDLEMYYRKPGDPGSVFSTMGFEPDIMKKWSANFVLEFGNSIHENIKKLFDKDKELEDADLNSYYNFLQEEAALAGNDLKMYCKELIPDCYIGCYAINLAVDGFYKGFYKGLSSPEKPIQLMTFNSEYRTYKDWLNRNDIFINHSSVLMLSKIRNKESFDLVKQILERDNGIWLNKFHRLSQEENGGLEWSPLPKPELIEFCDYVRTVK